MLENRGFFPIEQSGLYPLKARAETQILSLTAAPENRNSEYPECIREVAVSIQQHLRCSKDSQEQEHKVCAMSCAAVPGEKMRCSLGRYRTVNI